MFFVQRDEAVEILEEIIESCTDIDGQYLAIKHPDPSSKLSVGYQVYVKANLSGAQRKCFEDLLNQHGLAWHETEGETIIYRRTK